jgi:small subunit ribosomal protein S1
MDLATTAVPQKIDELQPKMKFTGRITKITLAGAIVDIGMGIPGVVHISQLQKDPVKRVEDVVENGQEVEVWVRRVFPNKQRIELTMIEPMALEWREVEKDMVVKGKVVRLEKFGAFVEIGAERPGLVHISELTHDYIHKVDEVVKEGDEVEVKILDVNRRKKQIKLSMKALEEKPTQVEKVIQAKLEKKSKPAREKKETSAPASVETPIQEVIPTAMEIALREAMERVSDSETPTQKKIKSSSNALEDILRRTLENKVVSK